MLGLSVLRDQDPDFSADSQASPCLSIKSRATLPATAPRKRQTFSLSDTNAVTSERGGMKPSWGPGRLARGVGPLLQQTLPNGDQFWVNKKMRWTFLSLLIFICRLLQWDSGYVHVPSTSEKALVSPPLLAPVPCIRLVKLGGFVQSQLPAAITGTATKVRT